MLTFKDILKTDKSGLVEGYCKIPWQELVIDNNGNIFNCGCTGKVKINIGNILTLNSVEELHDLFFNNKFKESILDGSYRYCKANVCNLLQKQMIYKNVDMFASNEEDLQNKKLILYLQIDTSCNLQCPSCRNQKIINKNNEQTIKIQNILDKIDQLILPNFKDLVIRTTGNGELFSSHTMLSWFLNFDFEKYPNKFYLHTNATLLHQHKDYLLGIANKIDGFEISVDAASKETYESTRLGGKWEHLVEGIDIVKQMKYINPKIRVTFSFTVSNKNYMDISMFYQFVKNQIDESKVIFYKLQRWGHYTEDQWREANIFAPTHPLHNNLIASIKDVNFNKSDVQNSFEYLL